MHEPPLILIIDDDKQLSRLYKTKLESADFEVLTAKNGKEGLKKARAERPDLILLDLRMPVMNGIETMTELEMNPETKDIKILVLSSWNKWSSMKMSGETVREMGAEDFIEKDIDLDELVGRVRMEMKKIQGRGAPASD